MIQAILIVAAMSSLNSGLYSTGRVLRSLGMSKQAPAFTLKMSSQGVPWAGIVMTSVVFVFGAVLNFLDPGRVRDRPGGGGHRRRVHLGDDLRLPAAVAAAGQPRGASRRARSRRPAIRGPATSGSAFLRLGDRRDGHLGLAVLAVLLAQDRLHRRRVRDPDHRASCWSSAGSSCGPRWWPTPAAGSRRCGRRRADLRPGVDARRSRRPADTTPATNPIDPEANVMTDQRSGGC